MKTEGGEWKQFVLCFLFHLFEAQPQSTLLSWKKVLLRLRLTFSDVFLTKVCSGIRNGVRFCSSPLGSLVPVDVSQLLASSA